MNKHKMREVFRIIAETLTDEQIIGKDFFTDLLNGLKTGETKGFSIDDVEQDLDAMSFVLTDYVGVSVFLEFSTDTFSVKLVVEDEETGDVLHKENYEYDYERGYDQIISSIRKILGEIAQDYKIQTQNPYGDYQKQEETGYNKFLEERGWSHRH